MLLLAFMAIARAAGAFIFWRVVFFPVYLLMVWMGIWLFLQKGGFFSLCVWVSLCLPAVYFLHVFAAKEDSNLAVGALTSYQPKFVALQVIVCNNSDQCSMATRTHIDAVFLCSCFIS